MAKMHLFSEVKGVVLRANKPIEGAIVRQECHWHWTDEKILNQKTTTATGEFHFQEITGKSFLARILPHEPVVDQKIFIDYEGQTYQAWMHYRHDYEPLSEYSGMAIFLVCDLDSKPSRKGPNDDIYGICKFKP